MRTNWSDGKIMIRPYRPGDAEALYTAVRESVAEVGRWLPWCHPDYSRAESEAWIAASASAWSLGEAYNFAIFDAHRDDFAGGCGLNHFNSAHPFANLGYWIRTSCTGRGFASAAVHLVARFGFEALGLARVEIVVDVANAASLRVAERACATREGVLRRRLAFNERITDGVLFSLIPEDLGIVKRKT